MYQPTNVSHPGPDKEKTVMSMREGIDYISYIYIIYIYNIFLMVGLCVCSPFQATTCKSFPTHYVNTSACFYFVVLLSHFYVMSSQFLWTNWDLMGSTLDKEVDIGAGAQGQHLGNNSWHLTQECNAYSNSYACTSPLTLYTRHMPTIYKLQKAS